MIKIEIEFEVIEPEIEPKKAIWHTIQENYLQKISEDKRQDISGFFAILIMFLLISLVNWSSQTGYSEVNTVNSLLKQSENLECLVNQKIAIVTACK